MNKKGFVFIETIIAIVVLTSSLLLLYSSFNKILQSEKTRVYFDDIAYVYRSWYVQRFISNLNIKNAKTELQNDDNKVFITLGSEYNQLFTKTGEKGKTEREMFNSFMNDYDVNQVILVKNINNNELETLKSCTLDCAKDNKCKDTTICNDYYTNLSKDFRSYIKTVYLDVDCDYFLAIEYNSCEKCDETKEKCDKNNPGMKNCKLYYGWVSV